MVSMVNEECRVSLYQDYVTTAIKVIAEMYSKCHGGSLELPSFLEMTHESAKKETASEVIEHVKKLFSEG